MLEDTFFKQAKAKGYVARSAFKLQEIQQKHKLISPGGAVLDLGCHPGAWLQVRRLPGNSAPPAQRQAHAHRHRRAGQGRPGNASSIWFAWRERHCGASSATPPVPAGRPATGGVRVIGAHQAGRARHRSGHPGKEGAWGGGTEGASGCWRRDVEKATELASGCRRCWQQRKCWPGVLLGASSLTALLAGDEAATQACPSPFASTSRLSHTGGQPQWMDRMQETRRPDKFCDDRVEIVQVGLP